MEVVVLEWKGGGVPCCLSVRDSLPGLRAGLYKRYHMSAEDKRVMDTGDQRTDKRRQSNFGSPAAIKTFVWGGQNETRPSATWTQRVRDVTRESLFLSAGTPNAWKDISGRAEVRPRRRGHALSPGHNSLVLGAFHQSQLGQN